MNPANFHEMPYLGHKRPETFVLAPEEEEAYYHYTAMRIQASSPKELRIEAERAVIRARNRQPTSAMVRYAHQLTGAPRTYLENLTFLECYNLLQNNAPETGSVTHNKCVPEEPDFTPEDLPEEKETFNEVGLDNPIRQLSFSELIIFMHIDNK